jgi:hypothetical protein
MCPVGSQAARIKIKKGILLWHSDPESHLATSVIFYVFTEAAQIPEKKAMLTAS